jgi:alkylation response protein AidB-like acyl-CoA dehydrogenase
MTQASTVQLATERPTRDELLRRAREIAAAAKAQARKTEEHRCVSAELVGMMKKAGLFRILQPKAFGGFEYGFDLLVEVAAIIAAGCPSSGWVSSIGMAHQWVISLFPLEAQKEVWKNDLDAIAFGSYAPAGKITATDSGYSITGKWAFSSGCDHAQWYILGGLLAENEQKATPVFLLVDAKVCSIEDNWHTMGLAGTGSKIVVADNVDVAKHAVVHISELLTGDGPGAKAATNPLYRVPLLAVLPLCLAAPTMGMATGALATFIESMETRVTRGAVAGGNNRMAEFATVQLRVAEATGCIDAGRLMMFRDIAETEMRAARGEKIGIDIRIRNRLNHAFCTKLFVQAVDALFLASGGNAIYSEKAIQQYWRDIHAAGVHISLNWDAVGTMYGQHALGLEPKGQF